MPGTAARVGTADDYLNRICEQIQLTQTQFNTAVRRYQAVGKHLTEKDTALDKLSPDVFPQGSMLIRTTIRPMRKDKDVVPFDLDAVCRCETDPETTTSQTLYGKIESRLKANADYAKRLTSEPKCLRLNYEDDDFYLDVVPACKDPADNQGFRILIPDRTKWNNGHKPIDTWRPTDPLRFAAWFEAQCVVERRAVQKHAMASISPVPPQEPSSLKAPLRRTTQLLKRQRDLDFLGDDCRPTSILLTTLAGVHYRGEAGVADALQTVLDGISGQIQAASPRRIVVPNPTDLNEDLAKPMTESAYAKFCTMIESMRKRLSALRNPVRSTDLGEALRGLAGTKVAAAASAAVQDEVQRAGASGLIGVGAATAAIHVLSEPKVTQGVQPVPANTFHING